MEYNSTRKILVMPEYGRNIQKMINYVITIEDKEKRNKMAHTIVEIMAQMHPKVKESGDYRQKLWDHLIIISEYKLDVDSPYPYPEKDILKSKPKKLTYSDDPIKYKHYGRNIQKIIDEAVKFEEGPEKDALIKLIANHLKKSYLNWNRESVNDDLIFKQLGLLSNDNLKAPENFKLNETSEILARNKKKKYTGKRDSNGKKQHRKKMQ